MGMFVHYILRSDKMNRTIYFVSVILGLLFTFILSRIMKFDYATFGLYLLLFINLMVNIFSK